MSGITESQLHILQHSLGLTYGNQIYRNHFCTGEGSTDYADCVSLTKGGYMTQRKGNAITGGDDAFFVTAKGKALFPDAIPDPDDARKAAMLTERSKATKEATR